MLNRFVNLLKNCHEEFIKNYVDEPVYIKRRILYNCIVILVCIIISIILLLTMTIVKRQSSENPFFFIIIIIILIINFVLISKGISIQIMPLYSSIVLFSTFTYFINLSAHQDIIAIAMVSFITIIWIFVSYKWWHLVIHFINSSIIATLRIRALKTYYSMGILSENEYLLSINAYIYLLFTVLAGMTIYLIMKREINLSDKEVTRYKHKTEMYEEVIGLLRFSYIDVNLIKDNLEGYFDVMTGCLNRLAYHNLFLPYASDINSEDCIEIVYIDLNDLKYVNDNYGHDYGDKYLLSFVNVIKNRVLISEGIYRIGGDEFIVTTKNQSVEFLRNLLDLANDDLNKNFYINDFKGNFSYGIASTKEIETDDINEIEKLADSRMYAMKKHKKKITFNS